MRRLIPLALVVASLVFPVLGQDCIYVPPCALLSYARVIFTGVAIDPAGAPGSKQTRFRVEEVFKGLDKDQKEVTVGASFPGSEPYLILGQKNTDGSISIRCNGAARVAEVPDDVDFLRAFARGDRTTILKGRIAENIENESVDYVLDHDHSRKPLAGVKLVASANGGQYESLSDSEGRFRIKVPGAGDYELTATVAGYVSGEPNYSVSVEANSCSEQNLGMWTDATVSGKVFDSQRKPLAGVPVQIMLDENRSSARTALTDNRGNYKIDKLPPGKYLLGVSLTGLNSKSPFALRYYPGVSNKAAAISIRITGPQQITDRDFAIEDARKTREIVVAVKWPDGRPVTNSSVMCLSSPLGDQRADLVHRYTNAQGVSLCKVLADRNYEVQADRLSWSSSSRPVRPVRERQKVPVTAGEFQARVDLTIDEVNDISAKEDPSDMSSFNDQPADH